ncbi:unnamed protein product [Cochlearia groenlandica]
MEEHREESDIREPMEEEAGKVLGLSSLTQTLDSEFDFLKKVSCLEETNTLEVSDSCVFDVSETPNDDYDGGLKLDDMVYDDDRVLKTDDSVYDAVVSNNFEDMIESKDNLEETLSCDDVERSGDVITELGTERSLLECDLDAVEVNPVDDREASELCNDDQSVSETVKLVDVEVNDEKAENGASNEAAGEEETVVTSEAGNEVSDEKAICEVNGGACDGEQSVEAEKSLDNHVDGEALSVEEETAGQEKEPGDKSEEYDNKMDVDSKKANEENDSLHEQINLGSEIKGETNEEDPRTVSEVSPPAEISCEEDITNVNQQEENGEAMEIDYAGEEHVENDVTVGDMLDNTGNESAGASEEQIQDIQTAEAEVNDSNVVNEMEVDEEKENIDMATNLTETVDSADTNTLPEDAAPGVVEPLDHNGLFDPSSDITNFIDFSGVSSWSGNVQDLKHETENVSSKEDKKAIEVATVDCSETLRSVDAKSQEDENHQVFDQETVDHQQNTMSEDDDTAHEPSGIDPNQKEETEMEENPNNFDYVDDGTYTDIKTNGLKRKADVLSEDLQGETRKTVSLAKVSFTQTPSFKIGECIARAASQMAGSPSVLKGSNFDGGNLSVESFVLQLHCAATDPVKENVVSELAAGFFLDFRNSSASQQVSPENASSKRIRTSNYNAGGTEAFEFEEEMGDTYWTDRVIHNGGREQTPHTEKGNYQVVPVELKPAQVQRTRRPYRRRQSQISVPLPSASNKPANFDENAPAELIMNFSETDTIPSEKSLSKMFRHFGPIRESQTEIDMEKHRARVVFRKGVDAEVAYKSARNYNIFGTKAVNYELSYTVTETFKVQPYVVSLGDEEAALSLLAS